MAEASESPRPQRFAIRDRLRTLAMLMLLAVAACDGTNVPGTTAERAAAANSATGESNDAGDDSQSEEAVIYEASDASMLDEPGGVSDAKAFFSYADTSGSDHIVQGLHNVPPAYQRVARNLSNGATRPINIYDASATVRRASTRVASTKSGSDFNRDSLDVTVYSAEWCGACKRARQLLDSEGVDYVLRDIDDDPAAKDKVRLVLGKVRIPLININGTYVTGYDRKMIMNLIQGA